MLLSVVIPVYNGEKYLEECIGSIINQGVDSYEIIAVDDGSTDCSLKLLMSFEKRMENIHVYNQENKGAAAARNLGLRYANGRAVMFMDCDDWLEPGSLRGILDCFEGKEDMLIFSYRRMGQREKTEWIQPNKVYRTGKDYLVDVLREEIQGAGSQCWRIYRKSFLDAHNIQFNETYRRMQDWLFNLDCMQYIEYVKAVDVIGYNWRIENSTSLTYRFASNFPDAVALYRKKLFELMKVNGLDRDKEMVCKYRNMEMALFKTVFDSAMDANRSQREKWKSYQECLLKGVSYSAIRTTQSGLRSKILLRAKKDNSVALLLLWKYSDIKYWCGKGIYIAAKYIIPRDTLRRRMFNKICQREDN